MVSWLGGPLIVDNILIVQEVAHSLENNIQSLPRMIIKEDIGNTYDTIEWNAILATFRLMNFPEVWISWIEACLSFAIFLMLINEQPSKWIRSQRGIRQGYPISPYLFILVSQNLMTIVNYALHLNIIPGFDELLKKILIIYFLLMI